MNAVQPMLATAGPLPTGPGWAYEFKWDGVRTLADVSAGRPHAGQPAGQRRDAGVPGAGRAGRGRRGRAARRRGGRLRRRPAVVLRPAGPDARARRRPGPPAGRAAAGDLPGLRRAAALRRGPDGPAVRRPAGDPGAAGGRPVRTGRCRRCSTTGRPPRRRPPRTGWRAWSPSGCPRPTGRDADRRVGQGAVRPAAGVRGRRLGARRGRPGRRDRLAAARACTSQDGRFVYSGQVGTGFSAGRCGHGEAAAPY